MKFKSLGNPILFVSDNPSFPTGLARLGRDVACLAATLPQFRVGYMGRGIAQNRKFPFIVYDYPESYQWGEGIIQQVWEDFSDGDYGFICTLDDFSRRHWFANPVGLPADLSKFLGPGRTFQKWGYFPIDSTGPNGKTLPLAGIDCISHYNRVLVASEWAKNVIITHRSDADWLPHGIFTDKFHPYMPEGSASSLSGWAPYYVVGCVMTNQARKDYPAAFECFATLKREYGNQFRAWLHIDDPVHYWNIYALAAEYGIGDCLEVTSDLTDDQMALRYSACDCTILPSAGEGFGYPIAESLACGTACIVTDYAGGAELVAEECRVKPIAYRVDTQHSVLRVVLSGYAFAQVCKPQIELKRQDWEYRSQQLAESVKHLGWKNLKHLWIRWLLEGLR